MTSAVLWRCSGVLGGAWWRVAVLLVVVAEEKQREHPQNAADGHADGLALQREAKEKSDHQNLLSSNSRVCRGETSFRKSALISGYVDYSRGGYQNARTHLWQDPALLFDRNKLFPYFKHSCGSTTNFLWTLSVVIRSADYNQHFI